MGQLEVVKDVKKDVEFWLKAIESENVNSDNKILLNTCLEMELNKYLYPYYQAKGMRKLK
ncbi:hypothetical protein [Bacillus infantis]|uniref:hypothetical protein n=1 Tax=Bacillus infantis TaxID=324767 RepID=UPI003CF3DE42